MDLLNKSFGNIKFGVTSPVARQVSLKMNSVDVIVNLSSP